VQHDAELKVQSSFQQRWAGVGGEGNGEDRQESQQAKRCEGNSCCHDIGEEVMAVKGTATKHAAISYSSRKSKESKFGPRKGSKTPGDHSNSLKVR
jgi:hypothetical protein